VFALPLSIGTESVTEFVDFKITEDMSNEEIARRVAAEFAPEMKVNGVWYPERKFTELMYAVYDIEIHSGKICDGISREVGKMFTSPLMVMKRSKSGEKEVDLSSMIKKMTVKDTGKVLKITATLPCDSANYLNPEYIVKAVAEKFDIDFNNVETEYYSIMRCGAKLADGETDFR
jgi:radical SAM-linked protein